MNMKIGLSAIFMIAVMAVASCTTASIKKTGEDFLHVKDSTNTLTYDQKEEIENEIIQLEKRTSIEMLLLMIDSTGKLNEIEYAERAMDEYNLGRSNGRGLIILIAKGDRTMRIQYTNAVLLQLSEYEAKEIIDNYFIPQFRNDRFYEGICDGIAAIGITIQ